MLDPRGSRVGLRKGESYKVPDLEPAKNESSPRLNSLPLNSEFSITSRGLMTYLDLELVKPPLRHAYTHCSRTFQMNTLFHHSLDRILGYFTEHQASLSTVTLESESLCHSKIDCF